MRISDWSSDVCSSDLAADDEDVERLLRGDLLGRLRLGAGVELREDLFEFHPALAEILAIQEDRRHRHDLTRLDLRLKQTAVDRGVGDARVDDAHQIERLHDVGAVLARQREIGFEMIVAVERADLLQHLGRGLGGVAPDLQQREDERGEFMAERDAREAHGRSEEHTSELQSLMRNSYAVFCLKKKKNK